MGKGNRGLGVGGTSSAGELGDMGGGGISSAQEMLVDEERLQQQVREQTQAIDRLLAAVDQGGDSTGTTAGATAYSGLASSTRDTAKGSLGQTLDNRLTRLESMLGGDSGGGGGGGGDDGGSPSGGSISTDDDPEAALQRLEDLLSQRVPSAAAGTGYGTGVTGAPTVPTYSVGSSPGLPRPDRGLGAAQTPSHRGSALRGGTPPVATVPIRYLPTPATGGGSTSDLGGVAPRLGHAWPGPSANAAPPVALNPQVTAADMAEMADTTAMPGVYSPYTSRSMNVQAGGQESAVLPPTSAYLGGLTNEPFDILRRAKVPNAHAAAGRAGGRGELPRSSHCRLPAVP